MVSPSDLSGFVERNWWESFSGLGAWIGYVLISLIIIAGFFALWNMLQYKIKVTYFPIRGDESTKEITLGVPKKDRGRRIKKEGIEHFRLLFARKTIKDIPYEKEYVDGVFLLRKSRDEFDPIPRPVLSNPSVTINVVDSGLQLWSQLRGQATRRRFTDVDLQKKQLFIFAGVIIGCLIFAGIVIWMSYATSAAARADTSTLVSSLQGLGEKIGLGAPG